MNLPPDMPASAKPKVVVGSGWWSPGTRSPWNIGDDLIRSRDFFALWHRQVMKSLDPDLVLVVDSHSPLKPDWQKFARVQWLELDRNYGHSNDIRTGLSKTRFSGSNRSKIIGAAFALCCDADYFVYVEQDCLLKGNDFLVAATGGQDFDFFCGGRTEGGQGLDGAIAAPMLQNSVLVMNRDGIERFIACTIAAPETDGEMPPEVKIEKYMTPYGTLLVPYGRSRPIDFGRSHFYAQHFTRGELESFLAAEGLKFAEWFPSA